MRGRRLEKVLGVEEQQIAQRREECYALHYVYRGHEITNKASRGSSLCP